MHCDCSLPTRSGVFFHEPLFPGHTKLGMRMARPLTATGTQNKLSKAERPQRLSTQHSQMRPDTFPIEDSKNELIPGFRLQVSSQ